MKKIEQYLSTYSHKYSNKMRNNIQIDKNQLTENQIRYRTGWQDLIYWIGGTMRKMCKLMKRRINRNKE